MKSCVNYPNSNSWKSDNLRKGNKGKKKKSNFTKNEAKKIKSDNFTWSYREKYNIAIANYIEK